ncbi:MAG TPA: transposase [Candidatus Hydrogenedentes bacterium]|nr:transposase [Candidatus Hydrogenedentota bacterium]
MDPVPHLSNAQKVDIVRRYVDDGVPIGDLSEEYGVSPVQIYLWKRQMAEAAINRRVLEAGLVTRPQL